MNTKNIRWTIFDVDWGNLGPSGVEITGSIADSCGLFGKKTVNRERARNAKIAFPRSHANGAATARLGVRDPRGTANIQFA